MITPKEIQEQCLKWWKDVLLSYMESIEYFPKEINRIGKVGTKEILTKLSDHKQSIEVLESNAKKLGYKLIVTEKWFDKIGKQSVPEKIIIEGIQDYLRLTGKAKEHQIFLKNYYLITNELPELKEWIKANPTKLIEHNTWLETLLVCKYFLQNPKPELYIRQLPIDIHTKYILENKPIVQSLLEFLIPKYLNLGETRFESKLNLKYSEPLIRIRFLDTALSPIKNTTDISLTLSEINHSPSSCNNIIATENLMNFLTLPYLPKTIAVWSGGGFNVSYLKDIEWLKSKQFYYWGDLDAQGFQILHQFRTYFPGTIAVMMDEETLSNFKVAKGNPATQHNLHHLSENELKLYNHLKKNNIRLEQEKITQAYAEERIRELF